MPGRPGRGRRALARDKARGGEAPPARPRLKDRRSFEVLPFGCGSKPRKSAQKPPSEHQNWAGPFSDPPRKVTNC